MPQQPQWPESHSEQTDVLPTVPTQSPEPASTHTPPRRKLTRRLAVIGGGLLGVCALAYGIDLLANAGNVPRGVTVAGVEVGGLDRAAAEQRLREQIEPRLTQPIHIKAGDVESSINPADAGLSLDWQSTLDQAGDQPLNPFTRLSSLFTTREVGVTSHADQAKVTGTVEALRESVDREPAEGNVRFEGARPIAVSPKQGQKLDVDAATGVVLNQWVSASTLELPVRTTGVTTTDESVQQALHEVAEPAVSGPLLVSGEGTQASVPPEAIAGALTFTPTDDGKLAPTVNHATIADAAGSALRSTEKQGTNAEIVFEGGKPTVRPSEDGKRVDWDTSLGGVLDVLKRTEGREIPAQYVVEPAEVTTEEANALGINEVIGEFSTKGFASDSGANIRRVAEQVNGAIVKPGQTFSLNGHTGPRGKAQGYVEAGVIEDGAPAREVGGGISQFATTMYNAAYFAGMKDAGHKEHSYYISRYPAAREATVYQSPNGRSVIDLKFTNDADTGVAIQTIPTSSDITIKIWGTKRYDVESIPGQRTNFTPPPTKEGPAGKCHASSGAQGFTASDTRVLRDARTGKEVRREPHTVRYNPQPKITCPQPPE